MLLRRVLPVSGVGRQRDEGGAPVDARGELGGVGTPYPLLYEGLVGDDIWATVSKPSPSFGKPVEGRFEHQAGRGEDEHLSVAEVGGGAGVELEGAQDLAVGEAPYDQQVGVPHELATPRG